MSDQVEMRVIFHDGKVRVFKGKLAQWILQIFAWLNFGGADDSRRRFK
jgi:hypothetical protein